MSKHCRECGKLMRLHHGTFRRSGGYYCINRNCPESDVFRYRTINGDLMMGVIRAMRLNQQVQE